MRRIPTSKTKLAIQRFRSKRISKVRSHAGFWQNTGCFETSLKDLPPIYNRLLSALMIQQSAEDAEEEESDED
jgi:hypothetical protein